MKTLTVGAMFLAASLGMAFAQPKAGGPPPGPGLTLTSPDFEDGGVIPDKYTQKGGQMGPNPELKWSQAPMGTQSFVLLLHDPEPVQGRGGLVGSELAAGEGPEAAEELEVLAAQNGEDLA